MGEQEIIAGIKQNNNEVFRQLVDKYQQMVLNTCYGFVNDRDDAKDLTQDVFIEFYNSIHSFRGDAKISTWLYRVAVNKSLNFIRKNKRKQLFGNLESMFAGKNEPQSSGSYNTDAGMENDERTLALNKALGSLPKNQRIAFTLHKIDGVPYSEIAEIMNVSLSSVESLIHRARTNLKKKLLNFYIKNME